MAAFGAAEIHVWVVSAKAAGFKCGGDISGETPVDAFEWTRTVEIPAMRSKALSDAVQSWALQDPAAAGAAVEALAARDRVNLRDVLETAKEEANDTRKEKAKELR